MYALDRNFIRDNVFFGLGKVATGPIHSTSPYYEPNVPQYPYDLKKAEALLDELGLTKGANNMRATIKLLGLPYGEVWNRLNEYCKQALRRIGLDVTIETSDVAGWGNRDQELGVRQHHLLHDDAVRSRARRRPHLRDDEHPSRHPVRQPLRLLQPEGRRPLRQGSRGDEGRGAQGALLAKPRRSSSTRCRSLGWSSSNGRASSTSACTTSSPTALARTTTSPMPSSPA